MNLRSHCRRMRAGTPIVICAGLVWTLYAASVYSLTIGAAQPPVGTVVAAIQTASGNYLTAVDGGGLGGPDAGPTAVALHTDATAVGPWETFTVIWLNSTYTQFALQTSGGSYVTAVNGGGIGGPNDSSAPVHTDATRIAEWERLRLTFLPNNQVTINVPDGRFLTAVNGGGMTGPDTAPMRTDAVRHAVWETFALVNPSPVADDAVAPAPAPTPTSRPVNLPATEGAWLVGVGLSGGLAGGYVTYAINSTGEGATSNARGNVRRLVSPNLLANVETQVRAARSQTWVSRNVSCNDCRRTSISLSLRQADGAVMSHSVGWTLLPSDSPSNARALVDAVVSALPSVPAVR